MDTRTPYIAQDIMTNARFRAASAVGDLAQTFHRFDGERFRWLAEQLRGAGCPEAAKLAESWCREHLETARRLADQAEAGI